LRALIGGKYLVGNLHCLCKLSQFCKLSQLFTNSGQEDRIRDAIFAAALIAVILAPSNFFNMLSPEYLVFILNCFAEGHHYEVPKDAGYYSTDLIFENRHLCDLKVKSGSVDCIPAIAP
jgi:hypothetical protein